MTSYNYVAFKISEKSGCASAWTPPKFYTNQRAWGVITWSSYEQKSSACLRTFGMKWDYVLAFLEQE